MPEYNPPISHYCHIKGYENNNDMFKIMGPNGHNFKRLTIKLNLEYIWWNIKTNTIELWGKERQVQYAHTYMIKYMERFKIRHCNSDNCMEQ